MFKTVVVGFAEVKKEEKYDGFEVFNALQMHNDVSGRGPDPMKAIFFGVIGLTDRIAFSSILVKST